MGSGTRLTNSAPLLAVASVPFSPVCKNPTMYATDGQFGLNPPPVLLMLRCGVVLGLLGLANVFIPRSA